MLPFNGPSYQLATRKASLQRAVNMHLVGMEAGAKSAFILQSVPGLVLRNTVVGEYRGGIEAGTRAFMVYGPTLYEVTSSYALTSRGTLSSSTGPVSMAYGLTQVVMVDGPRGYVLTLATNVFAGITDGDFPGAATVTFADNYFVFSRDRIGQQFQITALNDASNLDALDFSSAEGMPDDIVSHITLQPGLMFFGMLSAELFVNTSAVDFPFERARGAGFHVGLVAKNSLCAFDNGCIWLGRDKDGSGLVFRLVGGQPQRVSTQAVEQALQASTDITQAWGTTYQRNGLSFYCINAPGLTATWCYEASTNTWHERCDLDGLGQYQAGRITGHLFAFSKHFAGDASGRLYELDDTVSLNGSDAMVRERTSPNDAVPGRTRQFFQAFYLDATTGQAGQGIAPMVELSWSDDSGKTWAPTVQRSLGLVGEILPRLLWTRLGVSRDRIWRVRCSADAPFSIIDAGADAKQGSN